MHEATASPEHSDKALTVEEGFSVLSRSTEMKATRQSRAFTGINVLVLFYDQINQEKATL